MEAVCKRDFLDFNDRLERKTFEFGKSYNYETNDYYDILVYHVYWGTGKRDYHTLNQMLFDSYFCNDKELRKLKLKKLNKI